MQIPYHLGIKKNEGVHVGETEKICSMFQRPLLT
jgi:hypothetical protein